MLYSHKYEVESELGIALEWERADENKASWISYYSRDVSITNEDDWERMANFHAEWSDKICSALLPFLQENDEEKMRLQNLASILRLWTVEHPSVKENTSKSNRTFTRFTTDVMTEILPDIPNAPSGWNTDNHYFYEIVNRTGNNVYMQFALSSRNATAEFLNISERINVFYKAKKGKKIWQWRLPFRTKTVSIPDDLSKEQIFEKLDECFEEIRNFERDLKNKLSLDESLR